MLSMRNLVFVLGVLCFGCGSDDDDRTAGTGGTNAGGSGGGALGGSGGVATGGTDAGIGGSAGTPGDAGTDAPSGDPILAPEGVWTFVDFPAAHCANGTSTGIGVNLASEGSPALVYLMGGGGCWDEESCYVQKLAANIESGFDAASFASLVPKLNEGIFDREDPDNPFKNSHFVVVPYCTGDLHMGNAVQTHGGKPTEHVGYANLGLYLERLVPTFATSNRITLSGTSAGGFGAIMNHPRTQLAFGATRVDLIDDAGPWLPNPYLPEELEQKIRPAWALEQTLPNGCTACDSDLSGIFEFAATENPSSLLALLTFSQDDVVKSYMSLDAAGFTAGLDALHASFAGHSNLHFWQQAGTGHGLFDATWTGKSQNGVELGSWVSDMLNDVPSWTDVEAP
jgi:hypothetical protein